MSRKIDTSDLSALSAEDLDYLNVRGKLSPDEYQRLRSALQGEPESEPEQTEPEPQAEAEAEDEVIPPYTEWDKKALVEECKVRDLPHSGTVGDLVERLTQDDLKAAE